MNILLISQRYFISLVFYLDHQPHVKYEITFTINALIFYRDPFSISQTEIT